MWASVCPQVESIRIMADTTHHCKPNLSEPSPDAAETAAGRRLVAGHTAFDLPRWIVEHGLSMVLHGPWNAGGRRWVLNPCLWSPGHTRRFLQGTVARYRILAAIHTVVVLDPDLRVKLKQLVKRILMSIGHRLDRLVEGPSVQALFTRAISMCGLKNV
jgi:hypothetical protein